MLIENLVFFEFTPILPVRIINPHSTLKLETPYYLHGIIDTGASECCIPADIAVEIGHDFKKGIRRNMDTASGESIAYAHLTTINIYHPETEELIYTIKNKMIDFCEGLKVVLLGYNSFLKNFILNINYPNKEFSLLQK